jgi:hypothetical protein
MQYINTRSKGTTLFEVLLYIGLFTIISTATVYLYISIVKASNTLTLNLQKIEVSIFVRELVLSQIDMSSYIDTQKLKYSIERILKYYPSLKLVDIQVEYVHTERNPQIIDSRIGTNLRSIVKLTYQLQLQSKKVYRNTIYIPSF